MRNKIQAPDKQVLHKQVPKAQALQKEKDPRLVAVGGFGQVICPSLIVATFLASSTERPGPSHELLKGTPASTNPLFRSGHSEHNAAVATPVMMRGGNPASAHISLRLQCLCHAISSSRSVRRRGWPRPCDGCLPFS